MPTSPPPSSQGSIVTFDGAQLGRLTDFQVIAGTARFEEVTNVLSRVVGTGDAARVVSQYECLGIDPGGANITMRDVPPYVVDDVGMRGQLIVATPGGTLSVDAFLETFDVTGSVGQFLRGTARFRFSGT
jgi:hypothetical protein